MRVGKRQAVSAILASVMVIGMAVLAYAAQPAVMKTTAYPSNTVKSIDPPIEPQYATLLPDTSISSNGTEISTSSFTTTVGNGNDVRFFFDNRGSSTVWMRLQTQIFPGVWTNVAEQSVTPGNAWYNTYVGGGKSRITYRITLSADGYAYKGTLRVAQVP